MAVATGGVHPQPPYGWRRATGTFVLSARSSGCGDVPGRRGVMAAVALDPVQGLVGRGDEVGGVAAIGRERGHADGRSDRDRPALLADVGVIPEGLEDPL